MQLDMQLEVKNMIIDSLNLEDMTPEDINSKDPLFNEGLGLDSIDALELGVAIKKKYNITLSVEDKSIHKHFFSVETLASFIQNQSETTAKA